MKTTMASLEFEQSTLPSDDDGRQREREREQTKRRDKPVNYVNKRATMKASFADIKFDRMKNLHTNIVFAPNSDRPYNFKLSFWHEGPV